ncbi:MAG: hypothetical protein V1934_04330 [Methanobacteriota archaeon]
MKPEDELGRRIQDSVYGLLLKYGEILIQHGYMEAKQKRNLFYHNYLEIHFFADMRGTKEFPRLEGIPRFYWQWQTTLPLWKQRRLINKEILMLHKAGCPISIYLRDDESTFALGNFDYETGFLDGEGYCHFCKKDFQGDGMYCSNECEQKSKRIYLAKLINESPICKACGERIVEAANEEVKQRFGIELPKKVIKHHVSYLKNEVVIVCDKCHAKIHLSHDERYKELAPDIKRPVPDKKVRETKQWTKVNNMIPCFICGAMIKDKYFSDGEKSGVHQLCLRCSRKKRRRKPVK